MAQIVSDKAPQQAANVAHLPGIVTASLAMPDIHWGYGFPIGGVAAFDLEEGVISPGGVGYDINCGVRLMASTLRRGQVEPRLRELVNQLFRDVPTGVGAAGALIVPVDELAEWWNAVRTGLSSMVTEPRPTSLTSRSTAASPGPIPRRSRIALGNEVENNLAHLARAITFSRSATSRRSTTRKPRAF